MSAPEEPGRGFWVGLALGAPIMAFALWGVFAEAAATEPPELARWFVGGIVVHDALLAPLAALAGWVLGRVLPWPWRGPVRTGLFATAVVLAVGYAPLVGTARDHVPDNPSVQPLDYGTAVASVLGIVWLGVAVWIAVLGTQRRRTAQPPL